MATGPSLTPEDAALVVEARKRRADLRIVAISDAYRLVPFADLLYSCDAKWWEAHKGAPGYLGPEKWVQHSRDGDKAAATWGLHCVRATETAKPSFDPHMIATGANSGFQGVNLAVLKGAPTIILLGFDMAATGGKKHFFGEHADVKLRVNSPYGLFAKAFNEAAPIYAAKGIIILNASRRTALTCFRKIALEAVL